MKTVFGRFWAELRRRRVIKTTIAYVIGAWVVVEASSTVFPALLLPDWTVTLVVVAALVALPLVVVLAWIFDIERKGGGDSPPPPEATPVADVADKVTGAARSLPPLASSAQTSVAVMCFDSPQGDTDSALLAQGIATELHHLLSRVNRLRVAARLSSFAHAGSASDVRSIGKSLDVSFLITGSVICLGEQLHVTVEMDDTGSGVQVWSRTYDRTRQDLLNVLKVIAEDVASAFGGVQLESEIRQAVALPTANLNAWSRVQRARGYLLDFTPAALNEAVQLLENALQLDPEYAAARAALASVLAERMINGLGADVATDKQRAVELATIASDTSPNDPFVLKLSGVALACTGQYEMALILVRRAVGLAPYDLGAWGYLGWPLVASGKSTELDELHRIMQRMLDSAPSHPGAPFWLFHRSVASSLGGDNEQAVQLAADSVQQNPRIPIVWMQYANALGSTGRLELAEKAIGRAQAVGPYMAAHYEVVIRAMCGNKDVFAKRVTGVRAVARQKIS
ncbi:MAG TPA: hypothetical protein PKK10_02455 [Woeseiaceae bacterium]|nr:hypothetical protein [Woeseiaceae bacterium]